MTIDYTIILSNGMTLRDALEETEIPWGLIRDEVGTSGIRQIAINASEHNDWDLTRAAMKAIGRKPANA